MNITDQFRNDASIACVVRRPQGLDSINVTHGVTGEDVTTLSANVVTSLICNIDYEHIKVRAPYSSEDRRIVIADDGKLILRSADSSDAGVYHCIATNYLDADVLSFRVTVLDIKVYSGKTVEMRCKAEGRPVPVVSWILANRTQVMGQDNGRGRVTVTPEGTLVIRQVSVYDRGRYKCVASNAAGVDSVTMRLQVVAAPPNILEEKRQLLRANTGQGVWMPCTAQGDPQPTSHWVLFGGTVVRPPKTDSKVSVFPNGTLHMKNLDVSDSGKYECIATSSTGSERRVVTLSVKKIETAPQIVETSDWRTELEYGGNLHLNCSSTGNPKPITFFLPSVFPIKQQEEMIDHKLS
uniref:Ig-like domain-containing protein n=1 Tax=Electrophorus electricus TaxID=8005 RepID=A0A4W4HNK2_ELEEL